MTTCVMRNPAPTRDYPGLMAPCTRKAFGRVVWQLFSPAGRVSGIVHDDPMCEAHADRTLASRFTHVLDLKEVN